MSIVCKRETRWALLCRKDCLGRASLRAMDGYLARLRNLLGESDPLDVLRNTPTHLQAILDDPRFDPDEEWREGGWTGRAIVAHLTDQEIGFSFRARQTVADAGLSDPDSDESPAAHLVQPYDQDAWAKDYGRMDPALAVAAFTALRMWNLAWLARLDLQGWLATYYHPERDVTETVDDFVRFLAGHDLNHLEQLGAILDS